MNAQPYFFEQLQCDDRISVLYVVYGSMITDVKPEMITVHCRRSYSIWLQATAFEVDAVSFSLVLFLVWIPQPVWTLNYTLYRQLQFQLVQQIQNAHCHWKKKIETPAQQTVVGQKSERNWNTYTINCDWINGNKFAKKNLFHRKEGAVVLCGIFHCSPLRKICRFGRSCCMDLILPSSQSINTTPHHWC